MAGRYAGPACPRCGDAVDVSRMTGGEQVCPRCGRSYLAAPFTPPPPPRPRVESVAEAGPGGAVPCGRHAGNAAVATCARCGVFMCALCRIEAESTSMTLQELCPACFDRLSAEGVLSLSRTRIRDYRSLSLSLGFFGLFFCFAGMLTGPLTLYLVHQGVQQKRRMQESDGGLTLFVAAVLGVLQIAESGFLLWRVLS
jgi:hypothetical protein